jgi:hypothetical protein
VLQIYDFIDTDALMDPEAEDVSYKQVHEYRYRTYIKAMLKDWRSVSTPLPTAPAHHTRENTQQPHHLSPSGPGLNFATSWTRLQGLQEMYPGALSLSGVSAGGKDWGRRVSDVIAPGLVLTDG